MYIYDFAPDFGAIVPKKQADIVDAYFYKHIYGFAPDFGAIVPEKRADIDGVYDIYVHILDCSRFRGNCSQKTGRYSGGILHICMCMALHMILGQLFPKNGQI